MRRSSPSTACGGSGEPRQAAASEMDDVRQARALVDCIEDVGQRCLERSEIPVELQPLIRLELCDLELLLTG